MVYYVIVFWVSLIGHPDLVTKTSVTYAMDNEQNPTSCGEDAQMVAEGWTGDHAAWVLLTDELHRPRCVEKREI